MIGNRLKDFLSQRVTSNSDSSAKKNPESAVGWELSFDARYNNAILKNEDGNKVAFWHPANGVKPGDGTERAKVHVSSYGKGLTTLIYPPEDSKLKVVSELDEFGVDSYRLEYFIVK